MATEITIESGSSLHLQFVSGDKCFRGNVRHLETIPENMILVSKPKAEDFCQGNIDKAMQNNQEEMLVWYTDKDFLYSFKTSQLNKDKSFCLQLRYPDFVKKIELARLDAMLQSDEAVDLPYNRAFIVEALNDARAAVTIAVH